MSGLVEELARMIREEPDGARDALRRKPRVRRRSACDVCSQDILAALAAPAGARGIAETDLAARILRIVLRDGLVDAILDDGRACR